MKTASATLALALAAGVAQAQLDLYLVQTEDISVLSANNDNATEFWMGTNPSAIAFDGNSLFVGGFLNGPAPQTEDPDNPGSFIPLPWTVSIVKIENFLDTPNRAFRPVPDSRVTASGGRGFTGMDFLPGAGLIAAWDASSFGPDNQILLWDIETQLNPIFEQGGTGSPFDGPRGSAGPAWDAGFDGNGIDFQREDEGDPGFGTPDGPLPAMLIWDAGEPAKRGPLGLNPATLSGAVGATIYEVGTDGPNLFDPVSATNPSTLWRDLDIHPTNGNMVGRAGNEVYLGTRADNDTFSSVVLGPISAGAPFVSGQHAEILHGSPAGDLVVYNDRTGFSSDQVFTDVIKAADFTGNAVALNFLDSDGNTASLPDGNGYYSFSWWEDDQLLLVCDFIARQVYVFSTEAPTSGGCSVADVTTDGTNPGDPNYGIPDNLITVSDLTFFVEFWIATDASVADVTTDGTNPGDPAYGTPDGAVTVSDLTFFVEFWIAGCP
ncbi:MAG: GC-type dockerin domain-anchored protein [Planctomycetota bacterium]